MIDYMAEDGIVGQHNGSRHVKFDEYGRLGTD